MANDVNDRLDQLRLQNEKLIELGDLLGSGISLEIGTATTGDMNVHGRLSVGGAGLITGRDQFVIDDFESYTTGDVVDVASPPWTAHAGSLTVDIQDDGTLNNQVLRFGNDDFNGTSRNTPIGGTVAREALRRSFSDSTLRRRPQTIASDWPARPTPGGRLSPTLKHSSVWWRGRQRTGWWK